MPDRTYDLVQRMRELGAPNPEQWALSEISEDVAQEARWLLLRAIWPTSIDAFKPEGAAFQASQAVRRLVDAGADPAELSRALRYAAHYGTFSTLTELDSAVAVNAPADAPGWRVMETRFDDELGDHKLTGRDVGALHESLNDADPSGQFGGDLFE